MDSMHILVPIDFSTYAEAALTDAIRFGTPFHAHMTLLHVVDLPRVLHEGLNPYHIELKATVQQLVEASAQRVRRAGLAATAVITYGIPFQEIINYAKAQKIDLIIMGTHGRTGLQHVLLGSVTERVVWLAGCPVLVTRLMPHEADAASQDILAMSRGQGMEAAEPLHE